MSDLAKLVSKYFKIKFRLGLVCINIVIPCMGVRILFISRRLQYFVEIILFIEICLFYKKKRFGIKFLKKLNKLLNTFKIFEKAYGASFVSQFHQSVIFFLSLFIFLKKTLTLNNKIKSSIKNLTKINKCYIIFQNDGVSGLSDFFSLHVVYFFEMSGLSLCTA